MRQDSALWDDLHRGVLTSGSLNAALGLYEPWAAKQLGIPKSWTGHGRLLAAYQNLLLPEYTPPAAEQAVNGTAHSSIRGLHSQAHASTAQPSMYAMLLATWSASAAAPAADLPIAAPSSSRRKGKKKGGKGKCTSSGGIAVVAAATHSAPAAEAVSAAEAARLRAGACRRSAAAGGHP